MKSWSWGLWTSNPTLFTTTWVIKLFLTPSSGTFHCPPEPFLCSDGFFSLLLCLEQGWPPRSWMNTYMATYYCRNSSGGQSLHVSTNYHTCFSTTTNTWWSVPNLPPLSHPPPLGFLQFLNCYTIDIWGYRSLCFGGCPVHLKTFSSIPGFYLLNTSSTHSSACL